MGRRIFVNLPVADLKASVAFFTALGFGFDADFTDDTAACMVVSEDILVMLLTRDKFAGFAPRGVSDAHAGNEVLLCLSCDAREEVDETVRKAVAAGGTRYNDPQDHGFMYGHGFQDLDGHVWELVYMEGNP